MCSFSRKTYHHSFSLPGVPSAPRNVVSVVNQTSVLLEWHSPRDTGHREDLTYNVLCRRCHSSERRACQPCDDSVVFTPGKRGLKDTRVEISKLRAHTSYTFEVQVCPWGLFCSFIYSGMSFVQLAWCLVLFKKNSEAWRLERRLYAVNLCLGGRWKLHSDLDLQQLQNHSQKMCKNVSKTFMRLLKPFLQCNPLLLCWSERSYFQYNTHRYIKKSSQHYFLLWSFAAGAVLADWPCHDSGLPIVTAINPEYL